MTTQTEGNPTELDEAIKTQDEQGLNPEPEVEAPAEDKGEEERKRLSRTERMERRFGETLRRQEEEINRLRAMIDTSTEKSTEKPLMANFDTLEEWVEARDEWKEAQLVAKLKSTTYDENLQAAYERRLQAAKPNLQDWDEAMENLQGVKISPDTVHFIKESELGPQLTQYLGLNVEELERLNKLSQTRRLAELGKLEDKLEAKKAPTKQVTKAPTKLTDVKGTPVIMSDPDAAARAGGYAAWKAAKEAQKSTAKTKSA
jgi:hypothetical protein